MPDDDHDVIELVFSNGYRQREVLFYPESQTPQIDGGVVGHNVTQEEQKIIDAALAKFAKEELGIVERKSPRELATNWVNKNVVLAEHCDIKYSDLIDKLTLLLSENRE